MLDDKTRKEVERIIQSLRVFIQKHDRSYILCMLVRENYVEVLRLVAVPHVISSWATDPRWMWTFNGYRREAMVRFAGELDVPEQAEFNGELDKEFKAVWAKSRAILTPQELEDCLADEAKKFTEVDYRPAEGLPEDYYAG